MKTKHDVIEYVHNYQNEIPQGIKRSCYGVEE